MNRPQHLLPPVFDLARDIRSPRWWLALTTMLAGLVIIGRLAIVTAPLPAAVPTLVMHASADRTFASVIPTDEQRGAPLSSAEKLGARIATMGRHHAMAMTAGKAVAISAAARTRHRRLSLRRGERLVELLERAGLDRRAAYRWADALAREIDARRLRAGQRFDLEYDLAADDRRQEARLRRLSFKPDIDRRIAVRRSDTGAELTIETEAVPLGHLWGYAKGRITESLYVDARREGVPAPVLVRLMGVLGFVVDFEREIWSGDRFEILYARTIASDDGETGEGEPVHVALTLRGKRISFTRFVDPRSGRADYYDDTGHSVRRTLMKTPLDGARLTSRFGRRRHPILGYVRAHRGLDFGAPRGTPVYAAGDGTVVRASRFGSYGNYVRIRHGSGYETAYAHLSRFGRSIRKGIRVHQGQTIGYVGATGRATGPHLHYEVLVNGRQVDPLRLKLPAGHRLAGKSLARFHKWREEVDAMRAELSRTRKLMVAARRSDVGEIEVKSLAATSLPPGQREGIADMGKR